VSGMIETASIRQPYDRNSFTLCVVETASFCEMNDRKSVFL